MVHSNSEITVSQFLIKSTVLVMFLAMANHYGASQQMSDLGTWRMHGMLVGNTRRLRGKFLADIFWTTDFIKISGYQAKSPVVLLNTEYDLVLMATSMYTWTETSVHSLQATSFLFKKIVALNGHIRFQQFIITMDFDFNWGKLVALFRETFTIEIASPNNDGDIMTS